MAATRKKNPLNPQQERFCQLYASDREFFGNGVQSYVEAYEPDQSKPKWYQNACSRASELLSNPKVFDRINDLLEVSGLNDVAVDKQLSFLVHQHSDFGAKASAIREYNALRQRITKKLDVKTDLDLTGLFHALRNPQDPQGPDAGPGGLGDTQQP